MTRTRRFPTRGTTRWCTGSARKVRRVGLCVRVLFACVSICTKENLGFSGDSSCLLSRQTERTLNCCSEHENTDLIPRLRSAKTLHDTCHYRSPPGIYVTNPLAVVPEATVRAQLTSDSVLLVRRRDIILRWTSSPNLGALLQHPDTRWRTMNVVGKSRDVWLCEASGDFVAVSTLCVCVCVCVCVCLCVCACVRACVRGCVKQGVLYR